MIILNVSFQVIIQDRTHQIYQDVKKALLRDVCCVDNNTNDHYMLQTHCKPILILWLISPALHCSIQHLYLLFFNLSTYCILIWWKWRESSDTDMLLIVQQLLNISYNIGTLIVVSVCNFPLSAVEIKRYTEPKQSFGMVSCDTHSDT